MCGEHLEKAEDIKSVWDHPRMCGEHSLFWLKKTPSKGSPTHVRGTLLGWKPFGGLKRITPACAGNTGSPPICEGEKMGSPPHVRGTLG